MPHDRAAGAGLPVPRDDWALFLDVDGTLLELAETPDGVRVPASVRSLLARLSDVLSGAVALVSGRSVADLDRLFAPPALPVIGLHGFELRLRPDRPAVLAGEPVDLAPLRQVLAEFAAAHPGVLLEDKGQALALHVRRRPEAADAAARTVDRALRRLGGNFHVLRGKMVLEIKPADVHKGEGVERALEEPPFIGRVPVVLGDDVTDEDAFTTVRRLGGHAVKVGLEGPSAAEARLADVPAVHRWLADVAAALTARRSA